MHILMYNWNGGGCLRLTAQRRNRLRFLLSRCVPKGIWRTGLQQQQQQSNEICCQRKETKRLTFTLSRVLVFFFFFLRRMSGDPHCLRIYARGSDDAAVTADRVETENGCRSRQWHNVNEPFHATVALFDTLSHPHLSAH